ncbi:MAG: hypothetical protein SFX18_06935 [Pirellulales bacterium]|nr:hypothetical protein [Pirellulales bacterium]
MAAPTLTQSLTPWALLGSIWRQKLLFVAILGGILLATATGLYFIKKKYTATADLYIRLGRETISLDPTVTTGKVANITETRETEINSINELLISRFLLAQVVDAYPDLHEILEDGGETVVNATPGDPAAQFYLKPVYNLRDEAIRTLIENLEVSIVKKSNVVHVAYTAKDPIIAQKILSTILNLGQRKHMEVNRTEGSLEFFDQQVRDFSGKVDVIQEKLRDFKNARSMSLFAKEREILLERIGGLETEYHQAQATMATLEREIQSREKILAEMEPTVVLAEVSGSPQSAVEGMRQQLYALQLREKELLSKLDPDNVQIVQIREQISQAQKQLASEKNEPQITRGLNESFQQLEVQQLAQQAQRDGVAAKVQMLAEQLGQVRAQLAKLNSHEVDLSDLERELSINTENLRRYTNFAEQARIDQALAEESISNINIMPSDISYTPSSPRTKLILGLAGVMGCFLAALAAYARDQQPANYRLPPDPAQVVNPRPQDEKSLAHIGINSRLEPVGGGV